ncbi:hypothetical protein BDV25DRAFT_140320 [Aspergillus avenaceus]|uniref:S-adenosyl-L-methionine-dependent methyltransferase n=1 Tax=Aspergillus avenaceus TaxID=36643 RepID=A0A5N6TU95_ASPAV|nr:hypothetical protein BDV25DRAFT_140320 [Aspergillus avenaceus]
MSLPRPKDNYLLSRDSEESKRLNTQHQILTKIAENTLIHPTIPVAGLRSIADIGTGTGVWLRHVSESLGEAPRKRYYHGFDISAEQFPPELDGIDLSVQDITVPFHEEHWNRYDLVHVRLLLAGLAESDYRSAVTNIYNILKPGGYLQWEEVDEDSYPSPNAAMKEFKRCIGLAIKSAGKCFHAPRKICEESRLAGFRDVQRIAYTPRSDPEMNVTAIIGSPYARFLLETGEAKSEEEAEERAEELVQLESQLSGQGDPSLFSVMRVVGQKPVLSSSELLI